MIRFDRHTWMSMAALALMSLVLVVLAALQYRWIGELSEAEHARLRWALDNAANQFRIEFNAELRHIGASFQVPPCSSDDALRQQLAERLGYWQGENHLTGLVAGLYLRTRSTSGDPALLGLDTANGAWQSTPWPPEFERIRGFPSSLPAEAGSGPPRISGWRFFPKAPALARVVRYSDGAGGDSDLVVLHLDTFYLKSDFLPSLTRKHFGTQKDPVFDVAVMFAGESESPVFRSSLGYSTDWFRRPDGRWPLVRDRFDPGFPPAEPRAFGQPGGPAPGFSGQTRVEPPPAIGSRGAWRNTGMLTSDGRGWDLLARYRVGSLEEAVRISRRRNLALGFGVLLLLVAGMSILLIAARRAQRLAQLQVRFVAGISHDIRTPLAVIDSAADNLAVGVVNDAGPRSREYGSLIRGECRKLASMIEEILDYADGHRRVRALAREPLEVPALVGDALADVLPLPRSQGFEVETAIPGDLPPVLANRTASLQVLRNVLENAVHHAPNARWVKVVAQVVRDEEKEQVEIRIEDRGPGIDSADLPHLFKPFYRGRRAHEAGTRGSGLGLHLAHERVTAMGGTIRAENAAEGGSVFVVRLPAVREEAPDPRGARKDEVMA